jgi:hypothetical protein
MCAADFLQTASEALRYPQINLIRERRARPMRRERGQFRFHRVPAGSMAFAEPCQGGIRLPMLPGFRFLFAAIILSISILIFGLGAAALLRAAHEEFASNPTWRAPPETVFAQQSEPNKPVLATLVIEPPPAEQKKPEAQVTAAPEAPAVVVAPTAEPEQLAAAEPAETSPAEAAKAQPVAEIPPASEPVPAEASAAPEAPATDTKIAAVETIATIEAVPPPASETAPAPTEQAAAPAAPETDQAATKVATLGAPPAAVETPPPSKAESAAAEKSALKKRLRAQRARERRRLAALQRARLAQQATPQLMTGPFGQTTATATNPPRIR